MLFRRTVACWRAGLVLGPHDLLTVSAGALKGVALADDAAHVRGPRVEQDVRALGPDELEFRQRALNPNEGWLLAGEDAVLEGDVLLGGLQGPVGIEVMAGSR